VRVRVGIRAIGWKDFWDYKLVNWASFEVNNVFLGAKRIFGGADSIWSTRSPHFMDLGLWLQLFCVCP